MPAAALVKLCPSASAQAGGGMRYFNCKASVVAQDNLDVLNPINTWLAAKRHAPRTPLLPGIVSSSDGVAGVAKNDDCDFSVEPMLALFSSSFKQSSVIKAVGWKGAVDDEIDTDKDGNVIYLHAGDWGSETGGAEVNFPGVTGGTILESVYGSINKFLMCRLN